MISLHVKSSHENSLSCAFLFLLFFRRVHIPLAMSASLSLSNLILHCFIVCTRARVRCEDERGRERRKISFSPPRFIARERTEEIFSFVLPLLPFPLSRFPSLLSLFFLSRTKKNFRWAYLSASPLPPQLPSLPLAPSCILFSPISSSFFLSCVEDNFLSLACEKTVPLILLLSSLPPLRSRLSHREREERVEKREERRERREKIIFI